MSIARVTELSATSETSFEDAINVAVARTTKSAQGRRGRVDQGYERQHRGWQH
jgi:flavin-binding protein dodecin